MVLEGDRHLAEELALSQHRHGAPVDPRLDESVDDEAHEPTSVSCAGDEVSGLAVDLHRVLEQLALAALAQVTGQLAVGLIVTVE